MVVPDSLALVVRQRGGPNLILHTRGLPSNVVNRACEEAVTIMGRFAVGRGQTDVDGSGHIHPKFSHDRLLVMDGRYSVVYRLVFKVWVMAIAPSTASSFLSVRLVESATKGLINTCQILEVDQDVITRNYSEAHFMLGAVLSHQGANLQKAQVEALANIYSMIADSKDKRKGAGGNESIKRSSVNITCPTLRDYGGSTDGFNFEIPSDFKTLRPNLRIDLPPSIPSFTPPPVLTTPEPSFNLEDLIQKPPPLSNPPVQGLDNLDDFFQAPVQPTSPDPFHMGSPVIAMSKMESPAIAMSKMESPVIAMSKMESPVIAMSKPVPSVEPSWFEFEPNVSKPVTSKAPKQGPLLYHMEQWQGSFQGLKCTSSKAWGEVNLRKEIWKLHSGKELKFKILNNTDSITNGLLYSMKCSKLNISRGKTSDSQPGVFQMKIQPSKTPLLAYNLLHGSFQIPVKIHITIASSVYKAQESIVVLVQLMTNPLNPSPASGSVFAWVPQSLGPPNHVRPRPQFSRKQNRLKWSFQDLQPNKNALFKFVFTKKESTLNQEELARSIRVEMNAIGTPGSTFTGLSLSQELTPMTNKLLPTPLVCAWTASVSAKP